MTTTDLHGHSLRDGLRRRSKLDLVAKRLGNPPAAKLDPQTYAHDRRIRLGEGTSPKTLNNELGYLRSVYNELRGLGVITHANPLALVKPLKIQERELSWLTTEQIRELLEVIRDRCDNPHVEIITLICLATGARWSEAEKLKPTGLRHGVITFSGTKSGKVRSVPITADLEAKIRQHWKQHGQRKRGHYLVPPCLGQDDYPATERAGRSLATAHLRQSLYPERR